MKSVRSVEENRRAYHAEATLNSVHRASLTVPAFAGTEAEISFLNHFLIKRGYKQVGCRITAIDSEGKRIESRLHVIDEPRVYRIPLSGMVEAEVATWMVEFFSANNLYIPFPAVMVNHIGDGFINTVHAYNRVLNDVFEEDAVNGVQVCEASIDVKIDDDTDTFAMFTTGPQHCSGTIEVTFDHEEGGQFKQSLGVSQPRFTNNVIRLRELFPSAPAGSGNLFVRQPEQAMFYGRMLTGQIKANGAFSANHSYYDSSKVSEYWGDARESLRLYPLLPGLRASARIYPIVSPSTLRITIDVFNDKGGLLETFAAGELTSPGARHLDIDVTALIENAQLGDSCKTWALRAVPIEGNTPTRIAHQAVYGDLERPDTLESSISVGLLNPNIFTPEGKTGMGWGQLPVGAEIDSWLGVVLANPDGNDDKLQLRIYDVDGLVTEVEQNLPAGGAAIFSPDDLRGIAAGRRDSDSLAMLWFEARTTRPDVQAVVVSRHAKTGHCSGEHNF